MKIRTVEDGQEVIYVQMKDIAMLNKMNYEIPVSIYLRVADDIFLMDDSNQTKFIDFDDLDEIHFLNSLDWIIDYQSTIILTEREIELTIQNVEGQIENIQTRITYLPIDSKESRAQLEKQLSLFMFKRDSLQEILIIKRKELSSPSLLIHENYSSEDTVNIIPFENHGIKKFMKSLFQKQKSS